ncbi:MAG: hypothetical protein AAGJ96_07785 [Pseudomonadota bacterium]
MLLRNTALLALIILHLVMLAALMFQIEPHPPRAVAPFALGPFLGATLAVLASALLLSQHNHPVAPGLAGLAIAVSLVSFGPQKLLDPSFPEIWPSVLTAQIAMCVLGAGLLPKGLGLARRT